MENSAPSATSTIHSENNVIEAIYVKSSEYKSFFCHSLPDVQCVKQDLCSSRPNTTHASSLTQKTFIYCHRRVENHQPDKNWQRNEFNLRFVFVDSEGNEARGGRVYKIIGKYLL